MRSASFHLGPVLAGLLLGLRPAPAAAQLPPLTVPKGYARLEVGGSFSGWDQRYFLGQRQELAQDFIIEAAGRDFLPAIGAADSLVTRITGLTAPISIGRTRATQLVSTGTGRIGLAVGVTSRLTVFGMVPLRNVRVIASLSQDSATANAGFNPADPLFGNASGQAQSAQFFSQFDAALLSLDNNLKGGVYDGDPVRKALAQSTLAEAAGLRTDLFALLQGLGPASPFLPTQSSQAGTAILQRVASLQQVLSNRLDVLGFSGAPALPTLRLENTGFGSFLTNPNGPVAASLNPPRLTTLGDVELGAAYSVLDRVSAGSRASGVRVAVQGLVRLRTSTMANPSVLFDVGTGDRQPDVEGSVVVDLMRRRFGGRLSAAYNLQLSGAAQRRISPPSQPIAYASTLAAVTRNPGDEIILGAMPFVRITPTFAFVAGATYRRKGGDQYALLAGQDSIPGAPVSLLGMDSQASSITASAGLSYSARQSPRDRGGMQAPLDAGAVWEGVVRATGGRVPRASGIRFWLRIYTGIW